MSDLILKREIRKLVREHNIPTNAKMVCSIARVMQMRHKNIDSSKVCKIAKEILF